MNDPVHPSSSAGDRANFDWADPFLLEQQLSEEERMVRHTARDYAQDRLAPRVIEAFRREQTDPAIFREMGALGLLGATLQGYGCPGVNAVSYGLIAREIERVDSGYRSMLSVQSSLVMYPVYAFGDDTQKQQYLPALARGELIGCFGLTEADHGSDPAGMHSRAVKVAGGYRLNGSKSWISNAPIADIAILWAKDETEQVCGFIVERGAAGFNTPKIEGKLSLRTSVTGELVLQDVFVPDAQVLPKAQGLKAAMRCLNNARLGIAWGALGAAEACWHAARDYVLERKQFNRPLAANQLIQKKLADMQTDIALGLQGCLRASRLLDEGALAPELISLLKRNSCLKALAAARQARDMLGANGIADEFPVMRHMLNLETVNTYEGTQDIHALILGRAQTGIQAFY